MQDPLAQPEFPEWQEWLEGLNLDQPLWELINDPAWLEDVTLSPEELAHLAEGGKEYAQELLGRDAIPDTPSMDMPQSLIEPEHGPGQDHDLDLDR